MRLVLLAFGVVSQRSFKRQLKGLTAYDQSRAEAEDESLRLKRSRTNAFTVFKSTELDKT